MRRWLAVALMAAGCAILAVLLLQPSVTSHQTARAQQRLAAEVPSGPAPLSSTRNGPGAPVARPADTGDALATMRVPRFGDHWSWVAVEGTALDQLADGPGHYRGTPLPGARGNVRAELARVDRQRHERWIPVWSAAATIAQAASPSSNQAMDR